MTTIAARDGEMAADTQVTADYTLRTQKIHRMPDGGLVGFAGDMARGYAAARWVLDGRFGEPPRFKGATLLLMRPDGSLWVADDEFPEVPLLDRMAAIGSGSQAAMVAMLRGASAAEAVKQAAKVDPYTSEPVQMLALESKPRRRKARA